MTKVHPVFSVVMSGEIRLHFVSLRGNKIMELPPSSRRQATVHRTVALIFRISRQKKNTEIAKAISVFLYSGVYFDRNPG